MNILPKRSISPLLSAYPKTQKEESVSSSCSGITAQQYTLGPAENLTARCPNSSRFLPATICFPTANCWGGKT